jgi:hypothetical protein
MRVFLITFCLCIFASGMTAQADDPTCIRNNCMGSCISKEEALHKPIPMICHVEYSCYQDIECVKKEDGTCGWAENQQFKDCVTQKKKSTTPSLPRVTR